MSNKQATLLTATICFRGLLRLRMTAEKEAPRLSVHFSAVVSLQKMVFAGGRH